MATPLPETDIPFAPSYLRQAFDKRASKFSTVDFLAREVTQRMQAHLALIKIAPESIADIGCATGRALSELQQTYPKAQIIGLDWSTKMLAQAAIYSTRYSIATRLRHYLRRQHIALVQADWSCLPLARGSIDLLWSNLALQWTQFPHQAIAEWAQVVAPNGLLMFSTLGPDSLKELRQAFAHTDTQAHTLRFTDMHDLGDMLVNSGLANPVMDAEYLTVTYATPEKLLDDIRRFGVYPQHQQKGLKGRQWYRRLYQALDAQRNEAGLIPLTFELIYGHAWQPTRLSSSPDKDGIVHLRPEQIGRKNKKNN